MPELPEVETMCRGIARIVGRTVLSVERTPCRRKPISIQPRIDRFRLHAEGRTVTAVQRFGKRIVIWLGTRSAGENGSFGEHAIVIEPRMTGLVLLADPPTLEHLRFRICFKQTQSFNGAIRRTTAANQLLFWDRRGLGSVRLFATEQFNEKFGERGTSLGPDALKISVADLQSRLVESRRPIKVALLDQKALAGVGNLYASEMLHLAAIHPALPCNRLTVKQWRRLHTAMVDVLTAAIRYEGSTLSDGTYRNTLNEQGSYQNHHRVYDREGANCPTCHKNAIERIVQAQRSTFFCPACQRQ